MSSQQQADAEKAPWLGLLKWSLNYVDGTVPSSESKNFKAMSEEDKKFLEEVMKNGIVDEGDRMKVILNSLVSYLDSCLNLSKDNDDPDGNGKSSENVPTLEDVDEMMMELQDIVEQIDFAKSFASMGGLQFLIGCASASASSTSMSTPSSSSVPGSIRAACLGILATLCQNNPAVQMMMLEQGNIPKLIQIYFDQFSTSTSQSDGAESSSAITSKAMQAMSSSVRNHDVAEKIFCMNDDGIKMVETGLGMYSSSSSLSIPPPSTALRRRALFFLQALITSDTADGDRVRLFKKSIQFVACRYLDLNTEIDDMVVENDAQTREMGISMLSRILDQKNSVDALTEAKVHSFLVSLGVRRVSTMRSIVDGNEEKEMVAEELKLWEGLISRLSKAQ